MDVQRPTGIAPTRLRRRSLSIVCVVSLVLTSCAILHAQEPTLEIALSIPAFELARKYSDASSLEQFLVLAEGGATVQTPEGTITSDNVMEYRERIEGRINVYRSAIEERGFSKLPRALRLDSSTKECKRVGSGWAGLLLESDLETIEVAQTGYAAELVTKVDFSGVKREISQPVTVVETALAMTDYSNSSYTWIGRLSSSKIEFRPALENLDSWPDWASPPKKKDLEKCLIVLSATEES